MFEYEKLPSGLQDSMKLYIENGIHPGGFLTAVLENNLSGAVFKADQFNREHLVEIIRWMHWEIPVRAWGSEAIVKEWTEKIVKWTCNECGEYRPDDARVEGDMKCGYCAYSGGEMVEAEEY